MPKIRRIAAAMLLACLLAGLLSACLPALDDGISVPGGYTPPASSGETGQPADPDEPTSFSILLPADKGAFGQALAELAAADGNTLTVRTLPPSESYTAGAIEALESATPPDIIWLEGQGALDEFSREDAPELLDLAGADAGLLMGSLADLVPGSSRPALPNGSAGSLAGLPLGYYTEGYIVNIEMLAGLLGTTDTEALLENLYACDWAQWRMLVRSIESYLAKPGRIELRLGAQKYTTPGYRPTSARQLRGIFAVATGDAAAITGNAADLIMGLCFSSAEEMRLATAEVRQVLLEPVLSSLMGLFELETLHMAQSGGTLRRGEGFANYEALSARDAENLFVNSNALLLRGDSRQGTKIEQENPELAGKLAMIPVKLPPPEYIVEAEAEAEEALQNGGNDDATTALPELEDETGSPQVIPEEVAQALIANSNLGLWYAADGLLCVRAGTAAQSGVFSLLLRLYTTDAGKSLIAGGLNLYAFTDIYPKSTIAAQAAAETGPEGWQLVAPPTWLKQAKNEIGGYLQQNLLNLYVWDEESRQAFYTAGYAAFGARTSGLDVGDYTPPAPPEPQPGENEQDAQNSASNSG